MFGKLGCRDAGKGLVPSNSNGRCAIDPTVLGFTLIIL
jgi:hypothetical protein